MSDTWHQCEQCGTETLDMTVADRDYWRARAERAEAKICTRCKQSCKHLCSTPQADSDIEATTVAAIVAWLRADLNAENSRGWLANLIEAGAWRDAEGRYG